MSLAAVVEKRREIWSKERRGWVREDDVINWLMLWEGLRGGLLDPSTLEIVLWSNIYVRSYSF